MWSSIGKGSYLASSALCVVLLLLCLRGLHDLRYLYPDLAALLMRVRERDICALIPQLNHNSVSLSETFLIATSQYIIFWWMLIYC